MVRIPFRELYHDIDVDFLVIREDLPFLLSRKHTLANQIDINVYSQHVTFGRGNQKSVDGQLFPYTAIN